MKAQLRTCSVSSQELLVAVPLPSLPAALSETLSFHSPFLVETLGTRKPDPFHLPFPYSSNSSFLLHWGLNIPTETLSRQLFQFGLINLRVSSEDISLYPETNQPEAYPLKCSQFFVRLNTIDKDSETSQELRIPLHLLKIGEMVLWKVVGLYILCPSSIKKKANLICFRYRTSKSAGRKQNWPPVFQIRGLLGNDHFLEG